MFGLYNPASEYRVPAKQWNFEALQRHLGNPSQFPRRDAYQARRRFDDITHYIDIQLSAVVMENLFIQARALELGDTPYSARFFTPSSTNPRPRRVMAIIDLGEEGLSDK